jgi:hypothetical protein
MQFAVSQEVLPREREREREREKQTPEREILEVPIAGLLLKDLSLVVLDILCLLVCFQGIFL